MSNYPPHDGRPVVFTTQDGSKVTARYVSESAWGSLSNTPDGKTLLGAVWEVGYGLSAEPFPIEKSTSWQVA